VTKIIPPGRRRDICNRPSFWQPQPSGIHSTDAISEPAIGRRDAGPSGATLDLTSGIDCLSPNIDPSSVIIDGELAWSGTWPFGLQIQDHVILVKLLSSTVGSAAP
jgi:hypothetical protein